MPDFLAWFPPYPQPEPLRFVQIACDDEGRVVCLGRDGLVYRQTFAQVETQDHVTGTKIMAKQWVGYWDLLDYPVGKEAALEALRAQDGETP